MTTPLDNLTPEQQSRVVSLTRKFISLGFVAAFRRLDEGPVITRYYFKPSNDSVLSKVINKSEDLAMSVGTESVLIQRILDEVAIDIPNAERKVINFDAALHWLATSQQTRQMALPILMGQTTTGTNFALDLAEQPHLLIAGQTGSGKSVFLSLLITSLAIQRSPQELKLVLVDTKQLDLTLFSGLDHVVETVDTIDALYPVMSMLDKEVRKRTALMKGIARNIREWNSLGMGRKLPYFILIIDELADVITLDKEKAKDEDKDNRNIRIAQSIKSLAQISRAAGVHIIGATQRPSVKIIDGDIKTNLPTRISFKLPSSTDSRVILDEGGAEFLLGRGDYLFRSTTDSTIRRAHSAFVRLEDIAKVLQQHENIRETFACLNRSAS
jgi:DNA segregation ATPase FtsK/SpoIIIE, S-DNA-T family